MAIGALWRRQGKAPPQGDWLALAFPSAGRPPWRAGVWHFSPSFRSGSERGDDPPLDPRPAVATPAQGLDPVVHHLPVVKPLG